MNDAMTALSVHLAGLKPLADGSLCLDRDRLATDLGLRPSQMVRLLAKAEGKLGIQISGARVRYLTDHEVFLKEEKHDKAAMLAAVEDVLRKIDMERSQASRFAT